MGIPLLPLPVLQNWDCHATGVCCHEYRITLTPEEARRIVAQGWDRVRDLNGYAPFRRRFWPWRRRTLNFRTDDGCVFLSPEGRCRIHERHGYDAKPLACRLFPFVLVPVADHWRVSLRFACPSVAAGKGRPMAEHNALLDDLSTRLAERENLNAQRQGGLISPPPFVGGHRLEWAELLSLADLLLGVLRDRRETLERRWRKCLALANVLRQTRLDQLPKEARKQTLSIALATAADIPKDPRDVPAPSALGRVIFRLIAALCTRKDRGPNRGVGSRGWFSLVGAVLHFARGVGSVPRMNALVPEATFEQAEAPLGPLGDAAAEVIERYYAIKVGSLQFCGPSAFGLPFWEGLEALAFTLPLILWVMRLLRDLPREEAAVRALTIIDDHFSANPLLASRRLRLGFQTLARRGELARLIAWYSR